MGKILFLLLVLCSFSFSQENMDYKTMMEQALKMQQFMDGNVEAILRRISGDVQIKSSGSENFIPIEDNSYYPVDPDDVIKTGNGYVEIYFDDIGIVRVDRNTEIEIGSISSDETDIFLKVGAIISKIEKAVKKRLQMKIKTPTAVCAIRGTEFAVEYSRFNNESTFGVFDEGTISVSPLVEEKEGEAINIEKGNEVTISPSSKRYKVMKLVRMMKHRVALMAIRKNIKYYKSKWKRLTPQKREYLRQILLKKKARIENKKRRLKKNYLRKKKIPKNKDIDN